MFPFCRQAVVQKRAIYYMETVNNLDNLCDNLYSLDNLDNLCEYFNNVTFSYEVRKELGDQPHHQATNHPDKVCWTAGHSTWRGLLASARRSRKEQEAAASPGSGAQEGILGGASSKRAQQWAWQNMAPDMTPHSRSNCHGILAWKSKAPGQPQVSPQPRPLTIPQVNVYGWLPASSTWDQDKVRGLQLVCLDNFCPAWAGEEEPMDMLERVFLEDNLPGSWAWKSMAPRH